MSSFLSRQFLDALILKIKISERPKTRNLQNPNVYVLFGVNPPLLISDLWIILCHTIFLWILLTKQR